MNFKKFLTATIAVAAFVYALFGEDLYTQKLTAQFANESDRMKAEAKFTELPNGKTFAFSTRWDDAIDNAENMNDALRAKGFIGTFYWWGEKKNNPDFYKTVAPRVAANGGCISNHCVTHYQLAYALLSKAFYEIAAQRIFLEEKFDKPVVGFVLPGCNKSEPTDPKSPRKIGEMIFRSGHLVGVEPWNNHSTAYDWPNCPILSSNLFEINDRKPDIAKLQRRLENLYAKKSDSNRHATLGIHPWQSKQDMEKIAAKLAELRRSDWWVCSEHEFATYTAQFKKSQISKTVQNDGTSAEFTIKRLASRNLGGDLPLDVRISPQPEKVFLDGQELTSNADGSFSLKQTTQKKSPHKIDAVCNSENSKELASFKKFEGLSAVLFESDGKLFFKIENKTGADLEDIDAVFRLPLSEREGIRKFEFAKIENGKSEVIQTPLRLDGDDEDLDGDRFYTVECDFLRSGIPLRFHASTTQKVAYFDRPVPRDTAVSAGAFEKNSISQQTLSKISSPNFTLKNLGSDENSKWRKIKNKTSRWNRVTTFFHSKKGKAFNAKNSEIGLAVLEFASDKEGEKILLLETYKPRLPLEIWLNGKRIAPVESRMKIPVKTGVNRILAVISAQGRVLPISVLDDNGKSARFQSADFEN